MKTTTQPADKIRTRCFANRHLTPEEFGVWEVLRSISHSTGTLYFDGEKVATYFSHTGKNTIYRIVKSLIKKGWLFVQAKGRNAGNGTFMATQYQVLSHEEWEAINPGECIGGGLPNSIPETRNGAVPEPEIEDEPIPERGTVHSQNEEQPFPESGTTSPENRNGPFPESVTTIPGTGKYIYKEILLSGSSDFSNVAGRPAAPTIPLREARNRIADLDGWLAGCLSSILRRKTGTVIVPTKDECQKLSILTAKKTNRVLDLLLGFYQFAERDRSLIGLAYPISLFISQADQWIDYAKENVQEHTDHIIELVSDMVSDYEMPEGEAEEIREPLCELSYLESSLNDKNQYELGIVRTYLNLRYGQADEEPAALAERAA
jgi:hypothetical protein